MPVGMINVPAGVGRRAWNKCFTIMAGACIIFGVNEALYRRMKVVYATAAKLNSFGYAGLWNSPNPIFWDKKEFRKVAAKTIKLHEGRKSKYKGFNSARFMNVVIVKRRRNNRKLAILCVHLAAFNNNKVPNEQVRLWHAQSLAMIEKALQSAIDQNLEVWLIGDFNFGEYYEFAVRGAKLDFVKGNGIDKMYHFYPEHLPDVDHYEFEPIVAPTDHKHGWVARAQKVA